MKLIFLVIGLFFLTLGSIGVIIPVLPTTPFLLLASFFLLKGSTRFYMWFAKTKLYKNHLENFLLTRSMNMKTKIRIVSFASAMLLLAFFKAKAWYVQGVIIASFLFMLYYFSKRIKTVK